MKMSFNVPVYILDSCLAYTDDVIGKIEFTCKNNQLYIGATDNHALFLTQLSKFHNDGNMIGCGDFTFTFPARYVKGFIDGICKMKKITAKVRNMMFIEFRVSRDENKDVCVVMVDKASETQSTVLKVLDYRNDIYGTLVHNIPSLIGKNDPSKEESTHLPIKEYSRAKKVRKYIYLKGADPIFKENGWGNPAFIFDEKYIIVAQGFKKPKDFMVDSDFWKNV